MWFHCITRCDQAGQEVPTVQGKGAVQGSSCAEHVRSHTVAGSLSMALANPHLVFDLQIVVLDKLDYCASIRNLESVIEQPNVKVCAPGWQVLGSDSCCPAVS